MKTLFASTTATWALAATLTLLTLASSPQAMANESIYRELLPATTWIVNPSRQSTGTGVLVDKERRLVVTNYHVVEPATAVEVYFPAMANGQVIAERSWYNRNYKSLTIPAKVLECDPSRDLAIVQLEHVPETAKAVTMAQKNPAPGQTLHSIGNPGIGQSMWLYRTAKVRQTCHRLTPLRNSKLILDATVIQTQSGINQGDSGGPVVNDLGELVGISQGHQPSANAFGYCVAISELRALLETGSKASDHRLVQLLEAATLDFQYDIFGRFITHVENTWGEPRCVSLDSLTFEHNGLHFRNIWLEVRLADAALPHSVERGIMAWNRDANGPWKVVGHRDVWVKTYIPADATPEELHTAITQAEPHIDAMRSEITALLRRVQPTLTGDWVAAAGAQQASGIELTLSSTGNGLWREGLFSMSGPYVIQNGILAITRSSGQQFPLGEIKQTNADELILHTGSSQIRFMRRTG